MPNPAKTPSPDYLAFAEELVLRHPAVVSGSMFGMRCLKLGGKAFAGGFGDGLVLKLPAEAYAEAEALEGTSPFDPSGRGRPMGGWLVFGPERRADWEPFAERALAGMA